MKKLILSILALSGLTLASYAQTEKGKYILGGTAMYESLKSKADNAIAAENFAILPNVGYFVSDNFAVGTGFGFSSSKSSFASPTGLNESLEVSPFGRYYAGLSDQFKFFGQASVPMSFGTVKATDANGDAGAKFGTSTSIGIALSPGFAYFPTKKVGIEFAFNGISYKSTKIKDANDNENKGAGSENFSFGSSFFSPRIGVQFHF